MPTSRKNKLKTQVTSPDKKGRFLIERKVMNRETEPRPIEAFSPRDQDIIRNIDAALAGYKTARSALQPRPDAIYRAEPIEIDRSPHPRYGVPNAVRSAATLALGSEMI